MGGRLSASLVVPIRMREGVGAAGLRADGCAHGSVSDCVPHCLDLGHALEGA